MLHSGKNSFFTPKALNVRKNTDTSQCPQSRFFVYLNVWLLECHGKNQVITVISGKCSRGGSSGIVAASGMEAWRIGKGEDIHSNFDFNLYELMSLLLLLKKTEGVGSGLC